MPSSGETVYAPRGESSHANSRKVRSTWPEVIVTESYLGNFLARYEFSAYGLGFSLLRSTARDHLVRQTWRSSAFPHLRLSTRNGLWILKAQWSNTYDDTGYDFQVIIWKIQLTSLNKKTLLKIIERIRQHHIRLRTVIFGLWSTLAQFFPRFYFSFVDILRIHLNSFWNKRTDWFIINWLVALLAALHVASWELETGNRFYLK